MLNKIFSSLLGKNKTKKPFGFYLNASNENTFLYSSLHKNGLSEHVNYFQEIHNKKAFNKWLYPIFCDITLFPYYEHTLAGQREFIDKNKGYFFFDLSIEAIPYFPVSSYLSQNFKLFHEMLEQNKIDPNKVFFVNANLVANNHYDAWREQANVKYRINNPLLTHQYSLGGFSESFRKYFSKDNLFQKNIDSAEKSVTQNLKRKYHFTCLMLRPRYHRTTIMLHLLDREYIQKGIVSYFGDDFGHKDAPTVEKDELSFEIISQLKSGKRLTARWHDLENLSPITIDATLQTISEQGWAPKDLGFFPRSHIEDTSSPELKSYFEIVTETHFSDDSCLYITEKTLWAIVSLLPFIVVGSPFTLRYLKELGFQTFSPYINEDYDEVGNPALRIELILKEIDRLCSMSTNEIHELYCALWPKVLHNYHHYFNHSKELAVQQMQQRILNPITINMGMT